MEWSRPVRFLRIAVTPAGSRVTIRVAGELDIASAPALDRELRRAREKFGAIDLDLSRVTYCGVAGANVLLDAHRQTAADGGTFTVSRAHNSVLRPLEVCGDGEALVLVRGVVTAPLSPHEQRRRQSLVSQTLAVALQITGAPMGNAQLLDPAGQVLRITTQHGFHQPFLSFFETVGERDTACGVAAQDRKPVFVEETAASPSSWAPRVVSVHRPRPTLWQGEQRQALESLAAAASLLL
ncbi:STAS domain-containing protein [Streptomyces sp. NPDC050738]|uniref:STAS domain-containing protein n=1 Tax=Streptomyces sp. NPDC050738 TaxID=3154744 RepID=UPI00341438F6